MGVMAPLSQTVWEWSPGPRKKGRREITDPPQRRSWAGSGSLKRHGPPERAVGPVIGPHNSITCFGPFLGANLMELCLERVFPQVP